MATATISKFSMDGVFKIAHLHSRKWRYDFKAKKCAVVVYGESETENKTNMKHRVYRLGTEIVRERAKYEHLGLMTFNRKDCSERTKTWRCDNKSMQHYILVHDCTHCHVCSRTLDPQ